MLGPRCCPVRLAEEFQHPGQAPTHCGQGGRDGAACPGLHTTCDFTVPLSGPSRGFSALALGPENPSDALLPSSLSSTSHGVSGTWEGHCIPGELAAWWLPQLCPPGRDFWPCHQTSCSPCDSVIPPLIICISLLVFETGLTEFVQAASVTSFPRRISSTIFSCGSPFMLVATILR